jgi:hypothetical protein
MQQVDFVTAKDSRQLELLSKRIVLQAGTKFFCCRGVNQVLAPGRQNEQIFMVRRLHGNSFCQALHVPANSRIADSSQVESNFHAEP